jgi:hypothetical protein
MYNVTKTAAMGLDLDDLLSKRLIENFNKEKEKLEQTEQLFTSVYISTLIKNNLIKDFIQNESKNIEFFETGKSELLFKIDSVNYTINYRLAKIEKSDETKTLGLSTVFLQMKKNIQLQNSNYNYILSLIKKRGFADFGFIGAMRNESHTLEKQIKEYIALLLTIRRSEKDYMLRLDEKYIKKLKAESNSNFLIEIKGDNEIYSAIFINFLPYPLC